MMPLGEVALPQNQDIPDKIIIPANEEAIESCVSNPQSILNELNKYFTTIGPNLAAKLPVTDDTNLFEQSVTSGLDESFVLSPVGDEIVAQELTKLNIKNALVLMTYPLVLSKLHLNILQPH